MIAGKQSLSKILVHNKSTLGSNFDHETSITHATDDGLFFSWNLATNHSKNRGLPLFFPTDSHP